MNMDFDRIGQAANLALVMACRRLRKGGCEGEANRAWSWLAPELREEAKVLILENAEKIKRAPARKVVRQLSTILARHILETELASRKH